MYDILELSRFANYKATLAECGLMTIEDRMAMQKVLYVNGLHRRKAVILKQVLQHEADLTPEVGLRAEVRRLCLEAGLPDVNTHPLCRRDVSDRLRDRAYYEVWAAGLESRKTKSSWEPRQTALWNKPWYFCWGKLEGKLMLAYQLGELQLKTSRRGESRRNYGGVHCWVGVCEGDDELSHIAECPGYTVRPPDVKDGNPRNLAFYLIELNAERIRRWGQPLVFIRGF